MSTDACEGSSSRAALTGLLAELLEEQERCKAGSLLQLPAGLQLPGHAEAPAGEVSSPMSRQIAELSAEMDVCIASGRESRIKEALELPVEYAQLLLRQDLEVIEMHDSFSGYPLPIGPLPKSGPSVVVEDEATRVAEEQRIERLRAEVEELRKGLAASEFVFDAHDDPPLGVELGVAAWCHEVDVALEDPAFETSGLGDLEGRLLATKIQVGKMEDALSAAHGQVNAELAELDQLLAECSAMMDRPAAELVG
jgi:hypothetical protein